MSEDKKGDEKVLKNINDMLNNANNKLMKERIDKAKEIMKTAVASFFNQGFDAEEVYALLIGGVRGTPDYNPAMEPFYQLQIKRAIKKYQKNNGII